MTIIDMRIYTVAPRKLDAFAAAFVKYAVPVQKRYLNGPVAIYLSEVGPQNQFVHIYEYASLAEMERARAARDRDADFQKYLKATEGLVVHQENRVLRKMDFDFVMGRKAKTRKGGDR